eukprot:5075282-Lingulodinium_polyedra.AAC.1
MAGCLLAWSTAALRRPWPLSSPCVLGVSVRGAFAGLLQPPVRPSELQRFCNALPPPPGLRGRPAPLRASL